MLCRASDDVSWKPKKSKSHMHKSRPGRMVEDPQHLPSMIPMPKLVHPVTLLIFHKFQNSEKHHDLIITNRLFCF